MCAPDRMPAPRRAARRFFVTSPRFHARASGRYFTPTTPRATAGGEVGPTTDISQGRSRRRNTGCLRRRIAPEQVDAPSAHGSPQVAAPQPPFASRLRRWADPKRPAVCGPYTAPHRRHTPTASAKRSTTFPCDGSEGSVVEMARILERGKVKSVNGRRIAEQAQHRRRGRLCRGSGLW